MRGCYLQNLCGIVFIGSILFMQMCLFKNKLYPKDTAEKLNDFLKDAKVQKPFPVGPCGRDPDNGFVSGLYYSNWSPYEPRYHFPHQIDFSRVSHLYYAFFVPDAATGELKSTDEWSDSQMNLYKSLALNLKQLSGIKKTQFDETAQIISNKTLPKGCIGELFYLRHSNILSDSKNFKVLMSVGGWSGSKAFSIIIRDNEKFNKFINSTIDVMFQNGFDGIDLDWEFPADDKVEPQMYLQMFKRLREGLDQLEKDIFGESRDSMPKFELTIASPAFREKLGILPIKEMDKYITYWNMMTYDFSGTWSEKTAYHSNLYNGQGTLSKGSPSSSSEEILNADAAISFMTGVSGVPSNKLVLGMPAYGRGFANVSASDSGSLLNAAFSPAGGASKDEPGIWLYNQLPLKHAKEKYDKLYGSAYCYQEKEEVFVVYDNPTSMAVKAEYIKTHGLAGGFFWESCGDAHNTDRSLLKLFTDHLNTVKTPDLMLYNQPAVLNYYLQKYGNNGLLSKFIGYMLQKDCSNQPA